MCDTYDPVYNLWIESVSTDSVIDHAPKKRGRPKGSPNKSKLAQPEQPPAQPKKRGRPKKSTLEQPEQPPADQAAPASAAADPSSPLQQIAMDPVHSGIGRYSTDFAFDAARAAQPEPKKRGRPKGSPNKSKLTQPEQSPAQPKKRSADKHTRKSPKSIAAATTIQRYARRYINDYTALISQIHTS